MCSNRAATRVNILKAREKRHEGNARICSDFASFRKLQQSIVPLLHGGGQGFDSPRLHFQESPICRNNRVMRKGLSGDTAPVDTNPLRERILHSLRGMFPHAGNDVRIGIEGDRNAGVSEELLDVLRVHVLRQE
jgi:hypothetical protein